jgi:Tfp pilus assembly protein PilN
MPNDLNLIPPPDLEKKKAANRKALWAGGIIAALLLVGYFGIYIPLETKAKVQRELDANLVDENEYQAMEQAFQDLVVKLDAGSTRLQGLEGNYPEPFGWAVLLKDIEGVMPEQVHLKTMEFKDRGLYIMGIYTENADVSRLLVKLRGLAMIESARMLSITYNREDEGWDFEMQCDLPASVYPQETAPEDTDVPSETESDGSTGDTSQEGETAS